MLSLDEWRDFVETTTELFKHFDERLDNHQSQLTSLYKATSALLDTVKDLVDHVEKLYERPQ